MAQLEFTQLLHQPFWLASLGLALASWILALVGTVTSSNAESFAYWVLVYTILVVLLHTYAVLASILFRARVALVACNAVGIVYASRYGDLGVGFAARGTSDQVAGAGFIVAATMMFMWIAALGVDGSPFVLPGKKKSMSSMGSISRGSGSGSFRQSSSRGPVPPENVFPGGAPAGQISSSTIGSTAGGISEKVVAASDSQQQPITVVVDRRSIPTAPGAAQVDLGTDVVYKHKGVALYNYAGSVDDPNEIPFSKGEILEFVDIEGKWWNARKADGSLGIVPSNYFKVLEPKSES